jgi:MoaA/NifB/PqqE/SkfB family radical SAM enzyme
MVVLWRVTARCNLGCGFCGYDRTLVRPRPEADVAVVRFFGEVLAEHRRATGARVHVSWLGGEPLLWAPLAEVSAAYRLQHGLTLGLTTNGTRLAREDVRAMLLEHYADVTISVDGPQAMHDELRGRSGLHAALADAVKQLAAAKRAAGAGPLLRANVVLMRRNFDDFLALGRELACWGIEEITFNQLGGNDRPEFFPENRLSPEHARRLADELPRWREVLAGMGVRLCGTPGYLQRIEASTRNRSIAPDDCAPGRTFLFVDEGGRVSPCSFTSREYGVGVADLATPADLAGLPERFASARRRSRAAPCGDCHSTQVFGKWAANG